MPNKQSKKPDTSNIKPLDYSTEKNSIHSHSHDNHNEEGSQSLISKAHHQHGNETHNHEHGSTPHHHHEYTKNSPELSNHAGHNHGFIHNEAGTALLDVRHLSISFTQYDRGFHQKNISAIKDLNVTVNSGEIVSIVGASGSGKSLLAHAILGILPYNAAQRGDICFNGKILSEKDKESLRGKEILLVPQSVSYLDPLMKTGKQLLLGKKVSKKECLSKNSTNGLTTIKEVFQRYGLAEDTINKYPFELSGGMARRVLISSAVMEKPKLVIADEPTPGLHISVARRVLSHFREIADDGAGVLLITHDLELAIECADRIVVFYAGSTIEEAPAKAFLKEETLGHPYTKALFRAMPQNGFESDNYINTAVPDSHSGCSYAKYCKLCDAKCLEAAIDYTPFNEGYVRCVKT